MPEGLSTIILSFTLSKKLLRITNNEKKNTDNPIKKDPLWTIVRTKHKLKFHHNYFIIKKRSRKKVMTCENYETIQSLREIF